MFVGVGFDRGLLRGGLFGGLRVTCVWGVLQYLLGLFNWVRGFEHAL